MVYIQICQEIQIINIWIVFREAKRVALHTDVKFEFVTS